MLPYNQISPDIVEGMRENILWSDVGEFFARYDAVVDVLDETHPIRLLAEARELYEDDAQSYRQLTEEIQQLRNENTELREENERLQATQKVRRKRK